MPISDDRLEALTKNAVVESQIGRLVAARPWWRDIAAALRELQQRRAVDPPTDGNLCANCLDQQANEMCEGCVRYPNPEDHWRQATEKQMENRERMRVSLRDATVGTGTHAESDPG